MKKDQKTEASMDAGIKGFQYPLGKVDVSASKRAFGGLEKKKRKSRQDENVDAFFSLVARFLAEGDKISKKDETVKKRGEQWVITDDDTGVEVGSYKDRKTAWEKQRMRRKQGQLRKDREKNKKQTSSESFEHDIVQDILSENSLSYMFDQNPTSEDSASWEELVSRVNPETLQSDQKLRNLMQNLDKCRVKVLQLAMKSIDNVLKKAGKFSILGGTKVKREENGELTLEFDVQIEDMNKALPLFLHIRHNKPLIGLPDLARNQLNSLPHDDAKMLRAELMHAQETELDRMDLAVKAAEKRDAYLRNVQDKMDKTVSSLSPMQIALLKNVLKLKYRGMK